MRRRKDARKPPGATADARSLHPRAAGRRRRRRRGRARVEDRRHGRGRARLGRAHPRRRPRRGRVRRRVRAPGEVERFENAQRSSVFSQIGFERWGGGVGVAALQRTLGMYNNQIDADVLDEGAKLKLRISPAAPRFQRFQRFAINGFNVRSTVSTFDQRFQRSINGFNVRSTVSTFDRVNVQLTEEYTTTPLFSRAFSRSAQTPA